MDRGLFPRRKPRRAAKTHCWSSSRPEEMNSPPQPQTAGRSRLCEFTRDAWERQRYPMLVFDYYSDILLVDKIISGSACFAGVLPDGRPTVCRDGRELAAEAGEALFVRALLGRPAAREKIS